MKKVPKKIGGKGGLKGKHILSRGGALCANGGGGKSTKCANPGGKILIKGEAAI
jgi:hypothetical protein